MSTFRLAIAVVFITVLSGCTSYVGISKAADGRVYLTGSTSYFFIFSSNWVKRCTESGAELACETLSVKGRSHGDDDAQGEDDRPAKKKKKPGSSGD
jgi:hypothetical protein